MANNWPFDPSQTDAYNDARLTFLYDNIFQPYETRNVTAGSGYFGAVTRKGGWKGCKDMGRNVPNSNAGSVMSPGFVGDLSLDP